MIIEATAPNRIDLAGGTLDLYPLYLFEEYGITVNAAIDLGSWVRLEERADRGIDICSVDTEAGLSAKSVEELALGGELDLLARVVRFYRPRVGLNITTRNKAPRGSGLGSSSSLLIALSGALCLLNEGKEPGEEIIHYGASLEAQNIRVPTGKQDYYAALYGGVNAIWFRVEGNEVEPLITSDQAFKDLRDRVILSFSGEPRFSGATNWNMLKSYIENCENAVASMKKIKETALAMRECLLERDWDLFASLLATEWENRRNLAEGVTTVTTERIMTAARGAGALASKICGAGGGGCLITCCEPEKRKQVEGAIELAGASILSYSLSPQGLQLTAL